MINFIPTPLRIVTIISVAGLVLFVLSLVMPRYKVPGIERQLDALSYGDGDGDHDSYYKIRDAASTNKYMYADLGSGLIVFAIALYAFLSMQNINKFKDVKKIPAISTGGAYALANMAVLILIPGTVWYYGLRSARGDYPPFADSIGIPIMEQCAGFLIMLIPLNIYLLIAAVKSRQPALIFSKSKTTILRSVLWELFFGVPLLLAATCVLLSTMGGDHFLIIVSMFMVYVVLSLRAGKLGMPAIDIDEITPNSTYEEVILKIDLLLGDLKNKINENTIVKWSRFESVGDLLVEIDNYKARIYQHDASVFTDIHYEFAEAGSFRKIAMLNYWDRSFFKLVKRYDLLFAAVKLKSPTPIEAYL